jgi:hypothetical protein
MVESALAFRASEIMMRLNAPITATLALAVLCFLPATLLAKPAHRTANKPAVSEPAPSNRAHKRTAADPVAKSQSTRKSKRHATEKSHRDATPNHPTVRRIHSTRHGQASSAKRRISQATSAAASETTPAAQLDVAANDPAPKKATAADFLKAASAQAAVPDDDADTPHVDKALAIKARSTDSDESNPHSRSSATRTDSAAKPAPVVNVVRTTTERPHLESVEEAVVNPVILPALYNKRGRLIVPPPLKGSREILLRQNQVADRDGLDRVQNDDDLMDMRNKKMLVAVPVNSGIQVDDRLPANRRFCRPWTAQFLATLARAHYARFHTPLQVNSAVRTVEFQQRLLRTNGNAAPAEGETASPHLTGQAVDIAKHGLSLTEIAWLRGYLLPLVQEGKVDVEEEFQQACFHISVYKKYLPAAKVPRRNLASSRGDGTTALAAAIR